MRRKRFAGMKYFVVGILCFLAVGCASFPGNNLPKYTYEQVLVREPKPAVDYDVKCFSLDRENAGSVSHFQGEIEKVFAKSNVFSKFSPGTGREKYHLSLVLKNDGNIAAAFISGFVSGFTFTVLPGFARDNFTLIVDVKKGDQLLKQYRYENYMDTWIQLFMIFLTPTHSPVDMGKEVIDGMLLAFLNDLQKDNLLL